MDKKEIEKLAEIILPIRGGKTWVNWTIAIELARDILSAGWYRRRSRVTDIDKPLWRLLERYVKDEPWKAETVFVLANSIKKLFKVLGYHLDKEVEDGSH